MTTNSLHPHPHPSPQSIESIRGQGTELFQALFEHSPDAIVLIDPHDPHWTIVDCNGMACQMNGYSREELIGHSIDILNGYKADPLERINYLKRLRDEGHLHHVTKHQRKDGTVFPTEVSTTIVTLGGRELILGIDRDISERQQAEETLAKERNLLRTLIDNIPDFIYIKDTAGRYLINNMSHIHFLGMTQPDEVVGKTVFDFYPKELATQYASHDRAVIRFGNSQINREELTADRNGNRRWNSTTKVPLRDGQGTIVGLVGIGRDVTERKQAEEALRRQNEYLAALHEITLGLLSRLDLKNLLEAIVERAAQLVNTSHGYIYLPATTAQTLEMEMKLGVGLCVDEIGMRIKLGEGISGKVWQSQSPLVVNDYDQWSGRLPAFRHGLYRSIMAVPLISGAQVIGIIGLAHGRDTERVFNDEEVKLVMRFGQLASIALDNARLYAEMQQHAAESAALFRASAQLLKPGEDLAGVAQQIVEAVTREFAFTNCRLLIIDETGSKLKRIAHAGQFQVAGVEGLPLDGPGLIATAVRTGGMVYAADVATDKRYLAGDSRTRSELAVPLQAGDQIIGALDLQSPEPNTFDDRSRRIVTAFAKHAGLALENARLMAHLAQAYNTLQEDQVKLLTAEKMASLGRLTAGIAHEMNTPLATVRSGLSEVKKLIEEYQTALGETTTALEDHQEIGRDMRNAVQLAETAAERAASFVRGIKAQTRDMALRERQRFNTVPIIKDALNLLSHALRHSHCTLTFECEADPLELLGAPGRLAQVVTNLVTNGIDACAAHGGGTIAVRLTRLAAALDLQVTDSGVGIPPELISKIFDPMFTTKSFGEGTGLGLTIVRDIVISDFGGTIDVASQPGQGTTFTIHFPTPEEK